MVLLRMIHGISTYIIISTNLYWTTVIPRHSAFQGTVNNYTNIFWDQYVHAVRYSGILLYMVHVITNLVSATHSIFKIQMYMSSQWCFFDAV